MSRCEEEVWERIMGSRIENVGDILEIEGVLSHAFFGEYLLRMPNSMQWADEGPEFDSFPMSFLCRPFKDKNVRITIQTIEYEDDEDDDDDDER